MLGRRLAAARAFSPSAYFLPRGAQRYFARRNRVACGNWREEAISISGNRMRAAAAGGVGVPWLRLATCHQDGCGSICAVATGSNGRFIGNVLILYFQAKAR